MVISESSPDGQRSCQSLVVVASRTEIQNLNILCRIQLRIVSSLKIDVLKSFHYHLFFLNQYNCIHSLYKHVFIYQNILFNSFFFFLRKEIFYLYKYGLKLMHV